MSYLAVGLFTFGWWLIGGLPLAGLRTTHVLPTSQDSGQLLCSDQESFTGFFCGALIEVFSGQFQPYCRS